MGFFNRHKFGWVKQHDSMQCGVACLAMICRHYGKDILQLHGHIYKLNKYIYKLNG